MSEPRKWKDNAHLWSTVESGAGTIAVLPVRADAIHITIGWGSHDERGSTVLDIGRNITIRATGHVHGGTDGWHVSHLTARQASADRELTEAQRKRAEETIIEMVCRWIEDHPREIAEADDIDRSNDLLRLEGLIAEHVSALKTLRKEHRRGTEGLPFDRSPEVATDRRR